MKIKKLFQISLAFLSLWFGPIAFSEMINVTENEYRADDFLGRITLKGEIKNRGVLEKKLPMLPKILQGEEKKTEVEIEVTVLPDGGIDEISRLVKDSGNKEFNALADEAARMFRFSPIQSEIKQTGIIQFSIEKVQESENKSQGEKKHPLEIYGKLKDRKREKIALPRYPRWAEERGVETEVALKVSVNPDGKVETVSIEKSSG